ncbi:MAG: alkaline phosphatase family protein [Alicyclobacillus herbarius]|uniref:alkaline phosphatase family protein n=1 Tax=Alicyclobacillus herbarius TaxID=122960 RepID=UPI002356B65E|nr:alkaline phosphatase family protein [Alicyclobacillus herbarius]MCL6633857.1 alkaline phosphatase family protein [Alicyclobacillus herbarius]
MGVRFPSQKTVMPLAVLASTLAVVCAGVAVPEHVLASPMKHTVPAKGNPKGKIQHVIYIITDNVHQSDIEQMPAVVKFLHQGTFFTNDHTVLDSHTQDGMLSDMTGKYPSQTGVIDQGFYEKTASGFKYSSFGYWTNKDPDGQSHVTTTPNWTTFNQHGWAVGAVGAPDMELESKNEVTPSMMQNSTHDTNASDYLGVAVHKPDGTTVFGSPNLPYLYDAKSWSNPSQTLGGFPGWSDSADLNWSLQATYEMQTHGVPVTFTYLHEAHEVNNHQAAPGTYGSTLQAYNAAFANFFAKLKEAGIDPSNTLFVLTTDEGDHFMPNGELSTNLAGWLANNPLHTEDPNNITVYGDSGALVYLKDQSQLPQTLAALTAVPGWNYVADPTELKTLHMDVTDASDRNPSFVLFAKPNVYYSSTGSTDWSYNSSYLWNHGTISPDILHTWAVMVGPGVKANQTSKQWIDHADIMPTIYTLLGYSLTGHSFDGVPALSGLNRSRQSVPVTDELLHAESVYKQLNAPVGTFGLATLQMSTDAAVNATNSMGKTMDNEISTLTNQRDAVAAKLQTDILNAVEGHRVALGQLKTDVARAQHILDSVSEYAVQ